MEQYLSEIFARLEAIFSPEIIGDRLATFVLNLIVGTLTFAAFYIFWLIVDRLLRVYIKRASIDRTTASFIERTTRYIFIAIGILEGLSAAGIDTGALLASLGIAGLTIGFAARDALSNLISGMLIFWDRPFVIGDLIEVGEFYGRVEDITLRSTRVVTVDGTMLAVPNSVIINSTVASYTNFPHIRLDIGVTIAVTENVDHARDILLNIVAADDDYLQSPGPKVVMTAINDYNVALQLQAWLHDEENHIPKRFELREQVYNALNKAGIAMPFETIQLAPFELTGKFSRSGGD